MVVVEVVAVVVVMVPCKNLRVGAVVGVVAGAGAGATVVPDGVATEAEATGVTNNLVAESLAQVKVFREYPTKVFIENAVNLPLDLKFKFLWTAPRSLLAKVADWASMKSN